MIEGLGPSVRGPCGVPNYLISEVLLRTKKWGFDWPLARILSSALCRIRGLGVRLLR